MFDLLSRYSQLSDPLVSGAPYSIIVDEDKCIGCGLCVKQCATATIALVKREYSTKQAAACQYGCPTGVDIRKYMGLLADGGSFEDAWKIITEVNPIPAVTGRVCPHNCESGCNRSAVDSSLNISGVERSIGDYALENSLAFEKSQTPKKEKVAIIGSGPAGISCAYQLALNGYPVTIYEAKDRAGGKLWDAIPAYRLPKDIVSRELQRIFDLGIEVKYNCALGRDITLEKLQADFQAVYVAVGAQLDAGLGVPGEDAENVIQGLDFLNQIAVEKSLVLGQKVVVFGGGNTAVDAARSARRMGSEVTLLYRRSENEMPAYAHEVEEAQAEGVEIEFLAAPVKINKDSGGKALSVTCSNMELVEDADSDRLRPVPVAGSEFEVAADTIIAATGLRVDSKGVEALTEGVGWIKIGDHGQTSQNAVFAGGDVCISSGTVTEALAMGRRSAAAIDAYLQTGELTVVNKTEISYRGMPFPEFEKLPRNNGSSLSVEERFAQKDIEVALALAKVEVDAESRRCLDCGSQKSEFVTVGDYFPKICVACRNCEVICPTGALEMPHFYQVEKGIWKTHFEYPDAQQNGYPNPFMEKKTPEFSDVEEQLTETEKVIFKRRSVRLYTEEQVPREIVHRIIEAGRFAPSAGNCQPWQFLVLRDPELMAEINEAALTWTTKITQLYQGRNFWRQVLKKGLAVLRPKAIDQRPMVAMHALTNPKFQGKPPDVFFGAKTCILVLQNSMGISNPDFGAGICAQNMVLAAHSMGLGTCYVGFVSTGINMDKEFGKFKKRLGIEWPFNCVATAITVGYPQVQMDGVTKREFPKVEWLE